MKREIHKWFSPFLEREMELAVYGFYGYALLLFPTNNSDFLENENNQLVESISSFINNGTLKCIAVPGFSSEGWLNKNISPSEKAVLHQKYNQFIVEEVIPFIYKQCNGTVPVISAGASFGALHAVNSMFRRPDIFNGVIGMSGVYDIKFFSDGYYDDNCYFNSPVDYIPNIIDNSALQLLKRRSIIIASGQGAYEDAQASKNLSTILHQKEISHWLDLWGFDITHDWSTWKKMLPYYLENITI